jgi:hypothetical protein
MEIKGFINYPIPSNVQSLPAPHKTAFFLLFFKLGDYLIKPDLERVISSFSFTQSRSFNCFIVMLTSGWRNPVAISSSNEVAGW